MTAHFKDHFSGHAAAYARYRPHYPATLFDFLAGALAPTALVWDVATGSGQAARAMADRVDRVVASDASFEQLKRADREGRARYVAATAEQAPLASGSVGLVTVAQALHWLDLERFYSEVRRVSRPGGLIAAWTYDLFRVNPEFDALVDRLSHEIVRPFWPPERVHVESAYATLPFPFESVPSPGFEMTDIWSLERALGYLRTWSSVRRFMEAGGHDPVQGLEPELAGAWGTGTHHRATWPLTVRIGRVG